MNSNNVIIEDVRYEFTPAERLAQADELAALYGKRAQLEDEKKTASSHFKAQIDETDELIAKLVKKLRDKHEMVPTKCDVYFNHPTPGLKTLVNSKTLEVVRSVPMNDSERQITMFDPTPEGGINRRPDASEDYRPDEDEDDD